MLTDEFEIDEFSLGGHDPDADGRSLGKKALVAAAIEVRGAGPGRLRLQLVGNSRGPTLQGFALATTAPGAIVHTDGLLSYRGLAKLGYDHQPRKQASLLEGEQMLPRVHRAISKLKAWMHRTHRGVSDQHLPVYLDEYVFRHNRRGTPMAAFQTLLGLGAAHQPTTYNQITQRAT